MKRLESQILIVVMLSIFVSALVINHLVSRKSDDVTEVKTSLRELKELIRYEVQQTVRRGILVSDSTSSKHEPRGKRKSSIHVLSVSKVSHVVQTSKTKLSKNVNGETRSSTPTTATRRRYIVHLCDNTHACSGWGDRQRGVVAAFLLAAVTNRVFILNMTSPCNIQKFLQPNKYNWAFSEKELAGKSAITMGGVRSTDYHRIVRFDDVNKVYPQDVIYLRSNSDLLNIIKSNVHFKNRIPTWAETTRPQAFKNGWDNLMKPTPHILEHIDTILNGVNLSRDGDLVCAHVRIGKNPSVPNDSPNRNSISSVGGLWRFLQPYVKTASRVFIATDSLEVRRLAREEFGKKALDTGGTILHIDRQRKSTAACDGFEMVILEQLLLTKCHVLVVSASNFSIRGAFLRGKKDNLFIFRNGTVTPFSMGS